MSGYSQHNQGIGGKGIFVGLLLIALFVALLAFLGTGGSEREPGTAQIDPGAAAIEPGAAAVDTNPAPISTE